MATKGYVADVLPDSYRRAAQEMPQTSPGVARRGASTRGAQANRASVIRRAHPDRYALASKWLRQTTKTPGVAYAHRSGLGGGRAAHGGSRDTDAERRHGEPASRLQFAEEASSSEGEETERSYFSTSPDDGDERTRGSGGGHRLRTERSSSRDAHSATVRLHGQEQLGSSAALDASNALENVALALRVGGQGAVPPGAAREALEAAQRVVAGEVGSPPLLGGQGGLHHHTLRDRDHEGSRDSNRPLEIRRRVWVLSDSSSGESEQLVEMLAPDVEVGDTLARHARSQAHVYARSPSRSPQQPAREKKGSHRRRTSRSRRRRRYPSRSGSPSAGASDGDDRADDNSAGDVDVDDGAASPQHSSRRWRRSRSRDRRRTRTRSDERARQPPDAEAAARAGDARASPARRQLASSRDVDWAMTKLAHARRRKAEENAAAARISMTEAEAELRSMREKLEAERDALARETERALQSKQRAETARMQEEEALEALLRARKLAEAEVARRDGVMSEAQTLEEAVGAAAAEERRISGEIDALRETVASLEEERARLRGLVDATAANCEAQEERQRVAMRLAADAERSRAAAEEAAAAAREEQAAEEVKLTQMRHAREVEAERLKGEAAVDAEARRTAAAREADAARDEHNRLVAALRAEREAESERLHREHGEELAKLRAERLKERELLAAELEKEAAAIAELRDTRARLETTVTDIQHSIAEVRLQREAAEAERASSEDAARDAARDAAQQREAAEADAAAARADAAAARADADAANEAAAAAAALRKDEEARKEAAEAAAAEVEGRIAALVAEAAAKQAALAAEAAATQATLAAEADAAREALAALEARREDAADRLAAEEAVLRDVEAELEVARRELAHRRGRDVAVTAEAGAIDAAVHSVEPAPVVPEAAQRPEGVAEMQQQVMRQVQEQLPPEVKTLIDTLPKFAHVWLTYDPKFSSEQFGSLEFSVAYALFYTYTVTEHSESSAINKVNFRRFARDTGILRAAATTERADRAGSTSRLEGALAATASSNAGRAGPGFHSALKPADLDDIFAACARRQSYGEEESSRARNGAAALTPTTPRRSAAPSSQVAWSARKARSSGTKVDSLQFPQFCLALAEVSWRVYPSASGAVTAAAAGDNAVDVGDSEADGDGSSGAELVGDGAPPTARDELDALGTPEASPGVGAASARRASSSSSSRRDSASTSASTSGGQQLRPMKLLFLHHLVPLAAREGRQLSELRARRYGGRVTLADEYAAQDDPHVRKLIAHNSHQLAAIFSFYAKGGKLIARQTAVRRRSSSKVKPETTMTFDDLLHFAKEWAVLPNLVSRKELRDVFWLANTNSSADEFVDVLSIGEFGNLLTRLATRLRVADADVDISAPTEGASSSALARRQRRRQSRGSRSVVALSAGLKSASSLDAAVDGARGLELTGTPYEHMSALLKWLNQGPGLDAMRRRVRTSSGVLRPFVTTVQTPKMAASSSLGAVMAAAKFKGLLARKRGVGAADATAPAGEPATDEANARRAESPPTATPGELMEPAD